MKLKLKKLLSRIMENHDSRCKDVSMWSITKK